MHEEELRKEAKEYVNDLKGFYIHLGTYLVVNAGLFVLNFLTGSEQWWFWVTIFWGIGLMIHGVNIFSCRFLFSRKWEERQMKKYMDNNRTDDV